MAVGIVLFVIALIATFLVIGPERVWEWVGPADLGTVAFETLERRATPNDALACPLGICQAQSDVTPAVYETDAANLRYWFAQMLAAEPRITAVAIDDATMTDRYIQRSALMRYPDTIVVRFFDLPDGRSTIALYSRSQLGHGDMGVNRARIEHWLGRLTVPGPE